MIIPMVFAFSNAVRPLDEMWIFPPRFITRNPTMRNFSELFMLMNQSIVPFSRYIFNTFFLAIVGTIGHVIIASMAAYALAKHEFKGKNVIFSIIVLSLMFTAAVTGIPNFMIITTLGWMDTWWAVIVPGLAGSMGLYLMKQFMDAMVPDSILEAARIDGSSEWRIFWTIVMPIVKPAWLTLVMFAFTARWNQDVTMFIHTEQNRTLPFAINQIMGGGIARVGVGAAAAVLMMMMPIIVFIVTQSNIMQTMATSGMKE